MAKYLVITCRILCITIMYYYYSTQTTIYTIWHCVKALALERYVGYLRPVALLS
jgi:hypothetical protein